MKSKSLKFLYLSFFFGGLVLYAPVSLYLRTSRGITINEFFILQIIFYLSIALFEVPCGIVTDKIGYKKSIILSALMILLARSIFLVAHGFLLFTLEALIEGIGGCFASGTVSALLFEKVGDDKFSRSLAILDNFGTAGFILSTILFYFFYGGIKLEGLLVLTIISTLLNLICCFFIPNGIARNKHLKSKIDWKILTSRTFLILSAGDAVIGFGIILTNFFFVTKLNEVGINAKYMSIIILGYSAFQMLVPYILDILEKFNQNLIYKMLWFTMAILFIALALIKNNILVLIIMLIIPLIVAIPGYFLALFQNSVVDKRKSEEQRATVLSLFSMGQNFVTLLVLLIFSIIHISNASVVFLIGGVIIGIYALINLGIKFEEEH